MSRRPQQRLLTVQLLHELADGTHHIDWMIAQDPRGRQRLTTFRIDGRLDELTDGQRLAAERIGDHRPDYLTYEGPVAGGRGRVRRVARGTVEQLDDEGPDWRLQIAWESPCGRLRRQRLLVRHRYAGSGGAAWCVEALAAD